MIALSDPLLRTWLALVALSAAVTIMSEQPGHVAGAAILLLCGLKARLILSCYMGLFRAPAWQRGFDLVLALLIALLLGLYLLR